MLCSQSKICYKNNIIIYDDIIILCNVGIHFLEQANQKGFELGFLNSLFFFCLWINWIFNHRTLVVVPKYFKQIPSKINPLYKMRACVYIPIKYYIKYTYIKSVLPCLFTSITFFCLTVLKSDFVELLLAWMATCN